MGASASTTIKLNDELQQLYDQIHAQETKSVEIYDLPQLKEQLSYTFKKHKDVIIKILAMRSKDYLARLALEFNQDEFISLVGNCQYGKFLFLLTKSSIDVDLELLDIAFSGVGMNEMTVSCILGVLDRYELTDLINSYKEKYSIELLEKISGKVKKESAIATFFSCVLKADRSETLEVDELAADHTATEIHDLLSAFHVSRDNQNYVITLLCSLNRAQCKAIAKEYETKYKKTLESAINSVFSKPLSFGLNSFISGSKYEATQFVLTNTKESGFYEYQIARYDKSFLEKVSDDAKKNFLAKLTGNFKSAVETYFDSVKQCPDGGALDYLNTYLKEERLKTGVDIAALISDPNSEQYNEVKMHLKNGISAFHLFLGNQDVTLTEMKSKAQGPKSMKHKRSTETYESKEKMVIEYLKFQFDNYDQSGQGALDSADFWQFITSLPMDFLGFTDEEVSAMRDFCDWDQDGQVSFDEVSGELADTIITAMEATMNAGSFKEKMDILYHKIPSDVQRNSKRGTKEVDRDLAPDLLKYLNDTFEEYDIDQSGALDYEEFWSLIQAMNLGIGEKDYDAVMAKWDGNHDGVINWNEALQQFTLILKELASDQRDHYIGLVDKSTSLLFWYNLRDGTSTWMTREDNLHYGPHVTSGIHK